MERIIKNINEKGEKMNIIKKIVSITVAKIIIIISKSLGKKGSSAPGKIALKIYPDMLKLLAKQVKYEIITICGTNGKTTTNNVLYTLLRQANYKVVCNNIGANMLDGIVTAFISKSSIFGKLNADYACLEIDEAYASIVFEHLTPSKIIITNLFKDQLDRYGEIDITTKLINAALSKIPDSAEMIINGDDPLSVHFGHDSKKKCTYFGINQILDRNMIESTENTYCPLCNAKLNYEYCHYSQLGNYKCPACEFSRPELDFKIYDVSTDNGLAFKYEYNNISDTIDINYQGLYNIYNIAGALTAALNLNINLNNINNILRKYKPQIGRMETFFINKPVILNLSKNPAGFNQTISTLLQDTRTKNILIAINDNTQDGKDISWLWDVSFELLKKVNIVKYIVSGTRKYDMSLRLKYSDIDESMIIIEDDINKAINKMIFQDGEVCYVLVNYTALFTTQKILKTLEKKYNRRRKK